jgi:alkaline phosphatase D
MRFITLAFLLVLIIPAASFVRSQDVDKVGEEDKVPQYKRMHWKIMFDVAARRSDKALEKLEELDKQLGPDPETEYVRAAAYCQAGRVDDAVASMRRALELGLPPERFLGGTLTLLDPLRDTDEWRRLKQSFGQQVSSGPFLGAMTSTDVRVWVRTIDATDVQVSWADNIQMKNARTSAAVRSTPDTDFTATVPVTELKPETRYWYSVLVNGHQQARLQETYSFVTLPPSGARRKFRVAFGGCAGYTPKNERMWRTVAAEKPCAMVLTGDNVYSDAPDSPEVQNYELYRRQARPEFRSLTSQTPIYAIYDDHDFGANDCSGGPQIEVPAWKRRSWNVFRNNWVNASYGGGEANPGCWFDFSIGDVHFIMVDGRYYRTPPEMARDGKGTMLGPVQKAWLKETLLKSKGTFKVLVSPVPWVWESKGESPDTWNGYREERTEIFDFLAEHRIEGVLLLSGDRHRSDVWRIERPNGYALTEWESARLTNERSHPKMAKALFSYVDGPSSGLLDFDFTVADPTVTGRIMGIEGEELFSLTLRRSELK